MKCRNCGHAIKQIEVPNPDGNTSLIWVHVKQDGKKLACCERCFCGCEYPEPEESVIICDDFRSVAREHTRELIEEHEGDEEKALKEWLK